MAYPSRIDTFLDYNREWAKTWKNPGHMEQISGMVKKGKTGILMVTCLDPRCVPEQFFGPGAFLGVIRNAGGRASSDAIRSILVLKSLIDVQAVIVLHHTDCGMTHLDDASLASQARARTPSAGAAADIDAIVNTKLNFGCFTSAHFEESIKEDVRTFLNTEALKGIDFLGMALDTDTGLVTRVEL